MWLSAEVRWFWRDACPEQVRDWFHSGPTFPAIPPGGGSSDRIDLYLHAKGATEIGVKVRDAGEGADKVEVKGLVAVVSPPEPLEQDAAIPLDQIEIWCKWSVPHFAAAAPGVRTRKRRWMRRYLVVAATVEEARLDAEPGAPLPHAVGCNLELTRVDVDGRPEPWWTVGFEAFGDLQSAPWALAETFAFLQANGPFPRLWGERLSFPEWLDRL